MTDTSGGTPQLREPGVTYRRVKKTRLVTTVIDGEASQHEEEFYVDEPVPPRDWETLVQRALVVWASALVVVAFVGTCASLGGLFSELLHPGVAYLLGLVFTGSWLGCMGLEWLDGRIDPARATAARAGGWVALLLCMGAVFVYGYSHGLPWVGAAGACIDLLAKGFCTLLLRRTQVALPKGVSTWVRRQEESAAGRALLAERLRRLNRGAAYRRAVGGREDLAAAAMLTAAAAPSLPGPDTSGQAVSVSAPTSGQVPAPAQAPVSGPVPGPSGPVSGAPASAAPTPAATTPAQAAPAPPAPSAPSAGSGASGSSQQQSGQGQGGGSGLRPVGPLSIAAAVRQARDEDPKRSDTDMVARVLELRGGDDGGDRPKFTDTVTRTRRRQENQKRRSA